MKMRFDSCAVTIGEIRDYMSRNRIAPEMVELISLLETSLVGVDIEAASERDVVRVEEATFRLLHALNLFLQDEAPETFSEKTLH